jgi:hypothetical protein
LNIAAGAAGGKRRQALLPIPWQCDQVDDIRDKGMAVAVLNHNEPTFYCVPPKAYEELMDLVDDLELNRLSDSRLADGQDPLRVSLTAL